MIHISKCQGKMLISQDLKLGRSYLLFQVFVFKLIIFALKLNASNIIKCNVYIVISCNRTLNFCTYFSRPKALLEWRHLTKAHYYVLLKVLLSEIQAIIYMLRIPFPVLDCIWKKLIRGNFT